MASETRSAPTFSPGGCRHSRAGEAAAPQGWTQPSITLYSGRRVGTVDESQAGRQSGTNLATIIGGSGFVGSRLAAALLESGRSVRIVDMAEPDVAGVGYRYADVRARGGLMDALDGSDVVFNLAAVHRDDVKPDSLYDDVNVAGTANVCHACGELGVDQLVFVSSVAVYGAAAPDATEERRPFPSSAYGHSKLQAEEVCRRWQTVAPARRSLVIVRPCVVFGEGNRGNVYSLLRQIATRRFVMIGSGRNRKSMAYVGNLSAFLIHSLVLGVGTHLYNYADKPDLSMKELVAIMLHRLNRPPSYGVSVPYIAGYLGGTVCDLVAAATRKKFPISAVRVRKFCSTSTIAVNRVQATGFIPQFELIEALDRTIRYELANGFRFPPNPNAIA